MNRRAAAYYITGFVVLVFSVYYGRDFSNPADVLEGTVMLLGFVFIMLFIYWLEKQGLIPWWGWGKNPQYSYIKWNETVYFNGIHAVNDITRRSGMFNSVSIKSD